MSDERDPRWCHTHQQIEDVPTPHPADEED